MLDEGELEESMAELEESRRKLVILQLQKKGASAMACSLSSPNASSTPGRHGDKIFAPWKLQESISETKVLKCMPRGFLFCVPRRLLPPLKLENLHIQVKYFYFSYGSC